MKIRLSAGCRPSLILTFVILSVAPLANCGNLPSRKDGGARGATQRDAGGEATSDGGAVSDAAIPGDGTTDGTTSSDGATSSADSTGTDGAAATGETRGAPDVPIGDETGRAVDVPIAEAYVVAMVQSSKPNAGELSAAEVAELVSSAVAQAGGLSFIEPGQTVVLKPNLLTAYKDGFRQAADQTVNGIATDWRVVKAVADLVRARVGSAGKILVMEGSVMSTATAFSLLGYTQANIPAVDEFIPIEGSSCADRSTAGLVQRTGRSGTQHWVDKRYAEADVLISLPVMKTHYSAGITGAVKNLGIGATPVGQYRVPDAGATANDCTRGQTASAIDHSTAETLGAFIRDFYGVRPADFVVMDALQGLEHGPLPAWEPASADGGGRYSYDACKKNMRLILAGKNAVAVDTIEALVMKCDPKKVPYLTMLEADGLGTTDVTKITVVGKQVSEVATPFASKLADICPGI